MGALTSKPFAFTARSWELKSVNSINITDGEGYTVKVQVRGNEILRILPDVLTIGPEWISDRVRFNYDGWSKNRLIFPIFSNGYEHMLLNLRFKTLSNSLRKDWSTALLLLKKLFKPKFDRLVGLVTNDIDLQSFFIFKKLLAKVGSSDLFFEINNSTLMLRNLNEASDKNIISNFHFSFSMAQTLQNFERNLENADVIFLVNINLKLQAPLIFSRVKKFINEKNFDKRLILISSSTSGFLDQTIVNFGNSIEKLKLSIQGRDKKLVSLLQFKRPFFICFDQDDTLTNLIVQFWHRYWFGKYDETVSINNLLPFFFVKDGINEIVSNLFSSKSSLVRSVTFKRTYEKSKKLALVVLGDVTKVLHMIDFTKYSFILHQKIFNKIEHNCMQPTFNLPMLASTEGRLSYLNHFFQKQQTEVAIIPSGRNHNLDRKGWQVLEALANVWFNESLIEIEKKINKTIEQEEPFTVSEINQLDNISDNSFNQDFDLKELMFNIEKLKLKPKIFKADDSLFVSVFNLLNSYYINDSVSLNSATMNLAQKMRQNRHFNNFNIKNY